MQNRRFIQYIVLGIFLFQSAACDVMDSNDVKLTTSGIIEATRVVVSSELGGKVLEVLVEEGDTVQAGQVLARFDDQMLQAQLAQAEAALMVAEANYTLTEATSELEIIAAQQAIDDLYENADVAKAVAQQAVAEARDAIREAERWIATPRLKIVF